MSIGAYTGPNSSVGNGVTTVFPYTFEIQEESDLKVYADDVLVSTGYTVSGVGDPAGGNVTFSAAPASGVVVIRNREVPYDREVDYQRNGAFDERTVDGDFNRLEMQIQQIAASGARGITVRISETRTLILPSATERANTIAAFDEDGDLTVIAVPGTIPSVALSIRNVTATSYTLVAADDQNVVHMVNGGTVTVPTGLTVGHMTGLSSGSGAVAVVGSGGASVVKAATYDAELAETNSFATVLLRASNTWLLFGDLTLA